jgi:DNA repair protein SbcC/Rad50
LKLKKIILHNIRSYNHQELVFPEGSTLLSGDIGSGKTSILLGIEFALFGLQPGQRGYSLLKNDKNEGGVSLEFELEDKEIIIERNLKRGKTISQDSCFIIIDGKKKEISVSELKDFVLKILDYPKEFAKKQNLLYKFTVYTPQEEMKQIILQDSQTRLNTLRHVFGIDKYKKVLENISIVITKIREEKRIKEGMISNFDEDKASLLIREEKLKEIKREFIETENIFELNKQKRILIQEEKEELSKKMEEKIRIQQEIDKSKMRVIHKHETIQSNKQTISDLITQLEKLKTIEFDEAQINNLTNEIASLKKQKEKLSENAISLSSRISSISLKNEENLSLKRKMSDLEVCPTCLQNVDAVYRANVLNKIHSEISGNKKEIDGIEDSRKKIREEICSLDISIFEKEKKLQELNIVKLRLGEIKERELKISELQKVIFSLEKDLEILSSQIDRLKGSLFDLGKLDRLFETKNQELKIALNEEKKSEIKMAELKKEIEFYLFSIEELKKRISETEKIKNKLLELGELENWLSQKFVPIISRVEKNVMIKLRSEFSKLFEEWFNMLVAETFHISLDGDFTPIIEQQDYEIDYAYLSGGERTAIALAYRLALNQVINSLMSKIKTKDIVILDEPTDGFSEQQLDKMRDVLQQLNVKQLIIVSHEQKIEGFVDNVIRLQKENGISNIKL